jgi:hypothetical protein
MSCNIQPNATVSGDLQYWRWNYSLNHIVSCGPTYIRPDNGGSLQPWLLVVFQIAIHSPAVVVRMARWERVQILSLALALVMITIYIQAYVSTGLAAKTVLVWTPLTLILDAGSLLQILVLIVEEITLNTFFHTLGQILSQPARVIRRIVVRREGSEVGSGGYGMVDISPNWELQLIDNPRYYKKR